MVDDSEPGRWEDDLKVASDRGTEADIRRVRDQDLERNIDEIATAWTESNQAALSRLPWLAEYLEMGKIIARENTNPFAPNFDGYNRTVDDYPFVKSVCHLYQLGIEFIARQCWSGDLLIEMAMMRVVVNGRYGNDAPLVMDILSHDTPRPHDILLQYSLKRRQCYPPSLLTATVSDMLIRNMRYKFARPVDEHPIESLQMKKYRVPDSNRVRDMAMLYERENAIGWAVIYEIRNLEPIMINGKMGYRGKFHVGDDPLYKKR